MSEWLHTIQSWTTLVYTGFVPVTAVLIVLRLTWKAKAKLWEQCLFCSNILLMCAATCFAAMLLYSLFSFMDNDSSQALRQRAMGPYWYSYWVMTLINLSPLLLWIRKYRYSYKMSLLLTILVALPALFERVMIIVTSLYRDYLPSSWTYYTPGFFEVSADLAIYCGLLLLVYVIRFRIKGKPANAPTSE